MGHITVEKPFVIVLRQHLSNVQLGTDRGSPVFIMMIATVNLQQTRCAVVSNSQENCRIIAEIAWDCKIGHEACAIPSRIVCGMVSRDRNLERPRELQIDGLIEAREKSENFCPTQCGSAISLVSGRFRVGNERHRGLSEDRIVRGVIHAAVCKTLSTNLRGGRREVRFLHTPLACPGGKSRRQGNGVNAMVEPGGCGFKSHRHVIDRMVPAR